MASSSAMDSAQQRSAAFDARIEEVKFDRPVLNEVVMEYLIREGYTQAATNFAREANLDLNWDTNETDCMEERATIRNCIHAGKIEEAIERINDLTPELIELIRPAIADPDRHMMAALKFAEENLAPTAPTSPEYLRDLEETMTLLIFQPGKVHPSMAHLLEPDLKRDVAKRVNEAILGSLRGSRRNRLYELVKMREWSEKVAREAKCDIPSKIDIGLDPTKVDTEDSIMSLDGNGHSENVAMT